jgi:YesN/AraC family two-component response regulator
MEQVVDWKELGFEVVAKKKNGREVMDFLVIDEADVAKVNLELP